jgi:predicted Zn-dependent protease
MSIRAFAAVTAALSFVIACQKVPFTDRTQFNLVPDSLMRGIGQSSYTSTLSDARLEKKGEDYDILSKVGRKISRSANEPDYDWSFSLIDDAETINAWCLPGGYIAFYTGILPVLRNEAGMAFVMGHETAHATAHHGAERMSQQLALLGGMAGLELFLSDATKLKPQQRSAVLAAVGLGAEVGFILPFSRTHESEADVIGMMYMARAGYPPEESTELWDRMEKLSPSSTPAFLSTHPSNDRRKDNLRDWLPQAKKKYERNKVSYDSEAPLWAGTGGGGKAGGKSEAEEGLGTTATRD